MLSRAGYPNPATFPFSSLTLTLKPPLSTRLPESGSDTLPQSTTETSQEVVIDGSDLDSALQYGPSPGLTDLRNLLFDFQGKIHKREDEGWMVSMGSGTQDLLYKVNVIFKRIIEVILWVKSGKCRS